MRSTEKIGAWQDILTILSTLAVVTNAGIIVFTMNIFDDETDHTRFWIFILFQWVLLGFQLSLAILIPDVPAEVSIQQARQKVLVERAIYKIPGTFFLQAYNYLSIDLSTHVILYKLPHLFRLLCSK